MFFSFCHLKSVECLRKKPPKSHKTPKTLKPQKKHPRKHHQRTTPTQKRMSWAKKTCLVLDKFSTHFSPAVSKPWNQANTSLMSKAICILGFFPDKFKDSLLVSFWFWSSRPLTSKCLSAFGYWFSICFYLVHMRHGNPELS